MIQEWFIKQIDFGDEFNLLWHEFVDEIPGWLSKEEGYLLYRLASELSDLDAVEIGSYQGRSTVCIAAGLRSSKLIAIDPHTGDITEADMGLVINTLPDLLRNLDSSLLRDKVKVIVDTSAGAFADLSGTKSGLIFIDGCHTAEAVRRDITNFSQLAGKGCIFVIDDYFNSEVHAGISSSLDLLPKFSGTLGKVGVFGLPETISSLQPIYSLMSNDRTRSRFRYIKKKLKRI